MTKMRKLLALALAAAAVLALSVPAMAAEEKPGITAYRNDAVTIDGSLDEWNLDSPAVVNTEEQVIRDLALWEGENDCSVTFYLAWNDDNLYIAADVTENDPLGAIEMLPIDYEDNLKLYISTDPAADPDRTAYGTNDFLVYFIMDEGYWDTAIDRSMVDRDLRQRFVSAGMDGGEAVLDGYECEIQLTTTGFIWEAVVPWACFSNENIPVYAPQAGDVLSCDFAITDISYPCPGTEYVPQLGWTGTQKINSDPSGWGAVTLAE